MDEHDEAVRYAERCVSKAYGATARVVSVTSYEMSQNPHMPSVRQYAMVLDTGTGEGTTVTVQRSPSGWRCVETRGIKRELRP
jgi:hypothetical protein